MEDDWLNRWNERYKNEEFAYGKEPNHFLRNQLDDLPPAKILFAAEGEGRNAVYAATKGWEVSAFDISIEGQKKALNLANQNGVTIGYSLGYLEKLDYQPEQFNVIALIYAHFPAAVKSVYHQLLNTYLAAGGIVIFEAFSKAHLQYNIQNPKVGGPKDIDDLFSLEEIKSDFSNYEILLLEQREIELSEGHFHNGTGSVIRFVGRKKTV